MAADNHLNKYIALFALTMTSTLSTLSTDLYAPIQPFMPNALDATPEQVKLTVSLYFLAGSALYLLYGPLSERFGRRPILMSAIFIFALMSFSSAMVTTIEQLIVFRVLQGVAAGAETLLVLAIIRDYFVDREQVQAMSIYRAACGLSPMFAPILGVMIFHALGWRASFMIVGFISTVVLVILWRFLAESNASRTERIDLRLVFREYRVLITSAEFLLLSVVFVTAVGFFIIFHSAVPFVVHDEIGLPSEMFAYLQAGFMIAFIIGNIGANRLMLFASVPTLMKFALALVVFANVLLWYFISQGQLSLITLGIPILLLAFANGPIMSAVPTMAMAATRVSAGASSAMLLTIVSLLASSAAVLEGRIEAVFHVLPSQSIAITLSILAVIAVVATLIALRLSSSDGEKKLAPV